MVNLLNLIESQGLMVLEPRKTFDRAIVGVSAKQPLDHWPRQTDTPCVVYSVPACIEALMEDENWEYEDAWEFVSYNTMNAWMGEGTPTFEGFPDED